MQRLPMDQSPPTVPGELQTTPRKPKRAGAVLRGMGIHVCGVLLACGITPLAMGSNIWPIAAVFWSVLAAPVAAITGESFGWALRTQPPRFALGLLVITGAALGVLTGIVISQNR